MLSCHAATLAAVRQKIHLSHCPVLPGHLFTEEQIIGVLKEGEAGAKTADLARKHGISEATLYNWRAKYGGLEVSEAKRLRALEGENGRLKRLLADAMLDNAMLKEIGAKKW
jgi:putative transposase